ncbi:hypothetical protein [Sorangium sp. So ce1153]|uniref:hypothetical protein n=1 Tax=Sorangium sp. So ce1153 TaxID=3133333 RepID=UPI003F5FD2C3
MTMLPEDLNPSTAFDQSRAVLRGAVHAVDVPEVRKMVTIILALQQADVSISRGGFLVDFGFRLGSLSYWPKLAAPTLYALCRSHLGSQSARFSLNTEQIRQIRIGESKSDRWLWLFEEPRRILVFCREATHEVQPENPGQLERWVSASKVWAVFEQPMPCPHCRVSAARFRAVERALVCQACGLSWAVERSVLEGAVLETGS